jgi:copper resistance protein B
LSAATCALLATHAAAQDHSAMGHGDAPVEEPVDHSQMDHSAMGHDEPAAETVDHSKMDHSQMDHAAMGNAMPATDETPPPRALTGPRHAADAIWGEAAMAPAREQVRRENGAMTTGTVMFERLEARVRAGEDAYLWDAQGWYGGDIDKLWFKTEGEGEFGGAIESAEVQALWSHAIAPFFDLQGGLRYTFEPKGRAHAVLGIQGLAPYMFEIDAAAFLSEKGDLTARLEAEYDQHITQRLILQPRAEVALSAQDVPELGLGSGVTKIETGLRLRYEIAREFAPYVGVGYEAALGRTADIIRADGGDPDGFAVLVGLRAWF